jgi:hypothetical protein
MSRQSIYLAFSKRVRSQNQSNNKGSKQREKLKKEKKQGVGESGGGRE